MKVEEIIKKLRNAYYQHGRIPMSSDPKLAAVVKESSRKIGSWRKTLWLAGLITDERKESLPSFPQTTVTSYILKGTITIEKKSEFKRADCMTKEKK